MQVSEILKYADTFCTLDSIGRRRDYPDLSNYYWEKYFKRRVNGANHLYLYKDTEVKFYSSSSSIIRINIEGAIYRYKFFDKNGRAINQAYLLERLLGVTDDT